MSAHCLVRIRYAALFLLLPSVADASPSDVLRPLSGCIGEAAVEEKLLFLLGPDGQPLETSGIILRCDGAAAGALFKAIELVATQDMSNPPHVWRRSKGIQCDLETGPLPTYMCTVTIEAEPPLVKALQ
jgi:hypothetical protein